ncbi:MAG: 5-formyltetrahydrofolate cyclo-ligase [Nitriliruptor sp.]
MDADGTRELGGGGTDVAALRDRKAALRRATRAARDGLTGIERATASAAAVARLRRLPELRRARVVALYAAHGSELDLTDLTAWLRSRGVTTALPRVEGAELTLVEAGPNTPLASGYRGVREPTGRPIHATAVDTVVLPGLAFDPVGGRLGQGGGHYDRLLGQVGDAVTRIGVGFACQLVPRVPREVHDAPVDIVVTDRATYRTGARA